MSGTSRLFQSTSLSMPRQVNRGDNKTKASLLRRDARFGGKEGSLEEEDGCSDWCEGGGKANNGKRKARGRPDIATTTRAVRSAGQRLKLELDSVKCLGPAKSCPNPPMTKG